MTDREYTLLDCETTGLDPAHARIVELGAMHMWLPSGVRGEHRVELFDPGVPIPAEATAVHGITDAMVRGRRRFSDALPGLRAFLAGRPVIAHYAAFDAAMLAAECSRAEAPRLDVRWVCSLRAARMALRVPRDVPSHRLADLAAWAGCAVPGHRALSDVRALAAVCVRLARRVPCPLEDIAAVASVAG